MVPIYAIIVLIYAICAAAALAPERQHWEDRLGPLKALVG